MVTAEMTFPADFLWGTATAAYQVEGNNKNSDWWAWEHQPDTILDGHRSGAACNWWENAEADLALAAEMGTNAHRLSLEWSRIEPKPGVFDNAAISRYREILQAMIDLGIEPMVTLHHFSNPLWLVELGDFNSEGIVQLFRRYTERVAADLGDLVAKWITINEPMVYVLLRYRHSAFPQPLKRGNAAGRQAVQNLLRCHAAAYHTIKAQRPQAPVGVAKSMQVFEAPPDGNPVDRWWAGRVSSLFNDNWLRAMNSGSLQQPFGRGRIKHLAGSFDFIGINYYTRHYVTFPPGDNEIEDDWGPEALVSDGNYGEVYPYGLYRVIRQVLRYDKPIVITENGLPDDDDDLRPSFLLDHLRQIWHALSFCYPVMGYYHWSLIDNFEWERGWTQRFGLIELDTETQERKWRPSGRLYQEICHRSAISSDMAARYAPEMIDVMFPGEGPDGVKARTQPPTHDHYQDHIPEIDEDF